MPQAPARANGGVTGLNGPITFSPSMGLGAPTFTTSSAGERLRLRNTLSGSAANYAIGVETDYMWFGSDTSSGTKGFKWYGGTAQLASLIGGSSPVFAVTVGAYGSYLNAASASGTIGVVGSGANGRFGTSSSNIFYSNDTSGGGLQFFTNAGAGIVQRLLITGTGEAQFNVSAVYALNIAGTQGAEISGSASALGGLPAGGRIASYTGGSSLGIYPEGSGAAGAKVVIGAYNGSAWRSMFETAHVASGEPTVLLAQNGGNVGVGVAPTEKLHVYGASGTTHVISMENSATYHCKIGVSSSNIGVVGSTNATPLQFITGGTGRIYIHETSGLITMGGGLVAAGVTRRTSGASYTMVTGDRLVVFASGSSGTFNLIASPDTGRVVTARNDSGGNITLTPASGNINGAGTATLATGGGTDIYYDGTQWITI